MQMIYVFFMTLMLFIFQFAYSIESINDQQRIYFFDELIPKPKCVISTLQKINLVKTNEKCLITMTDQLTTSKKLIVKLSCKEDEVRSVILNEYLALCKSLTTKNTQPLNAIVTPAIASQTSTGSAVSNTQQPVFGGCNSPEQCELYMKEAAKPKYGWKSPAPFMNGPIDRLNSMHTVDGQAYELPTGACGPNNQGDLMAVNYGSETIVVACMGGLSTTNAAIMDKIKKTDISKIPQIVAVKKEQYAWQCLTKPDPFEKDQVRICNSAPRPCEKVTLSEVYSGGHGCGSSKCVRVDGGGLATDPAKPKEKGPCDD